MCSPIIFTCFSNKLSLLSHSILKSPPKVFPDFFWRWRSHNFSCHSELHPFSILFFFLPWPVFSHVPFFFFFALSLLRYKIDQDQLHCALVYLYFCKIKYNCFHFCKAILFLCIQDQYLMTSKEFLPTRQSLSLSKMF